MSVTFSNPVAFTVTQTRASITNERLTCLISVGPDAPLTSTVHWQGVYVHGAPTNLHTASRVRPSLKNHTTYDSPAHAQGVRVAGEGDASRAPQVRGSWCTVTVCAAAQHHCCGAAAYSVPHTSRWYTLCRGLTYWRGASTHRLS
jgi:hypothetical protein